MTNQKSKMLKLKPIIVLAVSLVRCASLSGASDACLPPEWSDPDMGPRVDQPNATDPTKTVVSWKGMVNNPECADAIRVWVWRKDIDAMNEKQVRKLTEKRLY